MPPMRFMSEGPHLNYLLRLVLCLLRLMAHPMNSDAVLAHDFPPQKSGSI